MALGQGYSAALEGRPASSNPYALGLPCDNESRASLTVNGEPIQTSTAVRWSGAHVLTIATVIARHDLPLALTSAYVGAPGVRTHVTHLQQGPAGQSPTIETIAFHDAHGPTASKVFYRAAECAYDHAERLVEWLFALGDEVRIDLADDAVAVLDAVQ